MPDENLNQRWCIYIDILGFSDLWEKEQMKALGSLRELMRAIYRIGTRAYPNEGERLFVHQTGDGFAIVSDFGEESLERPMAIAIALMRYVASTGTFAAAAIAEGEFADISSCYPKEVTEGSNDVRVIRLGSGVMTLCTVMGTAFISAYRLSNAAPSGPFLTVSERHRSRLPVDLPVRATGVRKGVPLLSVDWLRANSALLTTLQQESGLNIQSPEVLMETIQNYCLQYACIGHKWRGELHDFLDISV